MNTKTRKKVAYELTLEFIRQKQLIDTPTAKARGFTTH